MDMDVQEKGKRGTPKLRRLDVIKKPIWYEHILRRDENTWEEQ